MSTSVVIGPAPDWRFRRERRRALAEGGLEILRWRPGRRRTPGRSRGPAPSRRLEQLQAADMHGVLARFAQQKHRVGGRHQFHLPIKARGARPDGAVEKIGAQLAAGWLHRCSTSRSTQLRNAGWFDTAAGEIGAAMVGQIEGTSAPVGLPPKWFQWANSATSRRTRGRAPTWRDGRAARQSQPSCTPERRAASAPPVRQEARSRPKALESQAQATGPSATCSAARIPGSSSPARPPADAGARFVASCNAIIKTGHAGIKSLQPDRFTHLSPFRAGSRIHGGSMLASRPNPLRRNSSSEKESSCQCSCRNSSESGTGIVSISSSNFRSSTMTISKFCMLCAVGLHRAASRICSRSSCAITRLQSNGTARSVFPRSV